MGYGLRGGKGTCSLLSFSKIQAFLRIARFFHLGKNSVCLNTIGIAVKFEIHYLYRDASNYKNHMSVVVETPDGATPDQIENKLRKHFSVAQLWADILHFRPEDLGWPTAYFVGHDEEGDDLGLHEIDEVVETDKPVTASIPKGVKLS